MSRTAVAVLAAALVGLLIAGSAVLVREAYFGSTTLTAYFKSATGIYPGDEVRVAGVRVGTIGSVEPAGAQARMTLDVDHDVPIPADAKAVIVAQSLVAARYVQLTPAYESSGPLMADGAVIPVERTAIPVEWDEVKTQLMRLATDLGPQGDVSGTSVSRFIDSAADAMRGNGERLRQTLAQLSGVGRILADGSGDIVDILTNLQVFVSALRDSNQELVLFNGRLATLTSVLDDNGSELDAALQDLSVAVGDVQRFVAGSRDQTAEQIARLGNVTQNLVDHQADLENVLHVTPNAIANAYNIYDPDAGGQLGAFVLNNFTNPVGFLCGAIAAVENVTAPESAKLCAQYLGPALRQLNFNYPPFPINAYLMPAPDNVIYSEARLAPGGQGPKPVTEQPPSVSSYTGAGDVPAPPGYGQPPAVAPGPTAPDHLPAYPSPALFPGAPIPGPPTVSDMLLPAEAPPS